MIRLTYKEIELAKIEAERLSWTHKAHPRFEKEEYLLEVQLKKVADWLGNFKVKEQAYTGVSASMAKYIKLDAVMEIMKALLKEVNDG